MNTPINPKHASVLWAVPERSADVAALHATAFAPAWNAEDVMRLLEHPGSCALLMEAGAPRRPVGFIMGQVVADEAEILSITILSEVRRLGLGRRLLESFLTAAARAGARSVHLEVAASNAAAIRLYTSRGFKEAGRRAGYYVKADGSKEDALRLMLSAGP